MVQLKEGSIERLIKTHGSHDSIVVKRLIDILDQCSQHPRSVQELSELYEMHYQTIYKNVKTLNAVGLLEPVLKRGPGGSALYLTNWSAVRIDGGEMQFRDRKGDWHPASHWISAFINAGEPMKTALEMCGYAIISTMVNKLRKSKDQTHYSLQHELDCHQHLKETIDDLRAIANVLEQVADSPFWGEAEGHNMFAFPENIDINTANSIHDQVEAWRQGNTED